MVAPKPGRFGYIRERSVAIVTVKDILPVGGAEDIIETVVVVVPNAYAAGPSERVQTGLLCDVRECAVPIVFVESICSAFGGSAKTSSRKDKQIHPPIVVVVDECAAASR